MSAPEIETSFLDVDKKTALVYLQNNRKNRDLNKYRVKKYAEQMANRQWRMNGEAIIIGSGGELLDGQHRLSAIVEYDLKVKLMFCFNVNPDTFDTIDTGDSRTASDVLTIDGLPTSTAKTLSVCVRMDILMKNTGTISAQTRMQSKITPHAISAAVKKDNRYIEAVEFVEQFGKKNLQLPASALSFLAYRFFKINKDFSEDWLKGLISGVGIIDDNDPRMWIRNMLWREMNAARKRSLRHKIGIVIRAWNLGVSGRSIKHENNLYRDPADAYKYIAVDDDVSIAA